MDNLRRLQPSSQRGDSIPLHTHDELSLIHESQDPYPSAAQPSHVPQQLRVTLTPQDPEERSGTDEEMKNHSQARDEAVRVDLEDGLEDQGRTDEFGNWEGWREQDDYGGGPRLEFEGAWNGDRSRLDGPRQDRPFTGAAGSGGIAAQPSHSLGHQFVPRSWTMTDSSLAQSQPASLHHPRHNVTNTHDVTMISSFDTPVGDCEGGPNQVLIFLNAVAAFLSIFCCLCTGIAAFVVAIQVQLKKRSGQYQEAQQRLWCSFALVVASFFVFMPTIILIILLH